MQINLKTIQKMSQQMKGEPLGENGYIRRATEGSEWASDETSNNGTIGDDENGHENESNSTIVLMESKRLTANSIGNSKGNFWNMANVLNNSISTNGLYANNNTTGWRSISAEKAIVISTLIPGTILYYFEVTNMTSQSFLQYILVGLSSGNIADGKYVGGTPKSYATTASCVQYNISGNTYPYEWPNGATKPTWNGQGDVLGCGLLLSSKGELSIFFTGNGILLGKQIPFNSTLDPLYPTVSMYQSMHVEANFGEDLDKPFKFDIEKYPGLEFE